MAKYPQPRTTARKTLVRSRQMRREATDVERILWSKLRDRQLCDLKFRRQFPIGTFIADFCCIERRLVIEVDGEQHAAQTRYDDDRARSLAAAGFRTIRFWNAEVLNNLDGVLEAIAIALEAEKRL